jgi:hypothetical protein
MIPKLKNGIKLTGRILATVLASTYLLFALAWTLPSIGLGTQFLKSWATDTFTIFSLTQSWRMFAPNPGTNDFYISLKYTKKDGTKGEWLLSKMDEYSYLERYEKDRWRKYFNDYIVSDKYVYYWGSILKWGVKKLEKKGEKIEKIELWRHWRPANKIVSPQSRPTIRKEPFKSFKIASYEPETEKEWLYTPPKKPTSSTQTTKP